MANKSENEYILEIGVDASPISDSIQKSIDKISEMERVAKDSMKKADEAIVETSRSADKLNSELEKTKGVVEEAGKALLKNLDGKMIGGATKQIDELKKKLDEIATKRKLGLEIDNKDLKELEAITAKMKSEYEKIQTSLNQSADLLKQKSQESKEMMAIEAENVQLVTDRIKDLQAEFKKTAPGILQQGIIKQINDVNLELAEQQANLKLSKEEYDRYSAELKEVEKAQKDLTTSLVSSTREVDLLNGKFSELVVGGEEVAETLQVDNGLMNQFDNATGGAITKIRGAVTATKSFVVSLKTLRVALISTGIGALVVALGSLIAYFQSSEEGQNKFSKLMDVIGVVTKRVVDLFSELGGLLIDVFTNPMDSLKSLGDSIVSNITTRIIGLLELFPELGRSISLLFKGEFSEAGTVAANAVGKVALGIDDTVGKTKELSKQTKLWAAEMALAAIEQGKISDLNASIAKQERDLLVEQAKASRDVAVLREQATNREEYTAQQRIQFLNEAYEIESKIGDQQIEIARQKEEAEKRSAALTKGTIEDNEALAKATSNLVNAETERANKQRVLQRQVQSLKQEERRAAEQATKASIEEQERITASILKFTQIYQDSITFLMTDSIAKRRIMVNAEYDKEIADLKAQTVKTTEEIEARNKAIIQINKVRDIELLEVERQFNLERLKLQMDADAMRLSLNQTSMDGEIELLELDHERRKMLIQEQFKDDAANRIMLLNALEESTQRERANITQKWNERQILGEQELAMLSVDIIYQSGKRTTEAEYAKNVELLKIQREFAQQYLDNLIDDGTIESQVRIEQAKAQILELDNSLKDLTRNRPETTFWSLLGIDMEVNDQSAVENAFGEMQKNITTITDSIISQYDRQLAKKREVVNSLDNDISKLESDLDKEKQLRENGFANNVELMERELEEKKIQREEELRQMQELEEKKKAMQKAQFLFDSAIQAQNLITSSTSIYKALAPMGPLGIGLAIATIGTMFGAFAAQKIEAFNAINNQDISQFGDGGLLTGKSHKQGGVKYYSNDPKANIIELEGNEFVTNTRATKKYLPLLNAMNSGSFADNLRNDLSFKTLLKNMGIDLDRESMQNTMAVSKDLQAYNITILTKDSNSNEVILNSMLSSLKTIEKQNNERPQVWEENGKRYTKVGNKTTVHNLNIDKENGEI